MEELRSFMKCVAGIKPPYGDLVHNGIPGEGMPNMAADQTNLLYRSAHAFATAYQKSNANHDELHTLANDTEASLMAIATVGVISTKLCDELVGMLRTLLETKTSQSAA
jgi:hypothetical protein